MLQFLIKSRFGLRLIAGMAIGIQRPLCFRAGAEHDLITVFGLCQFAGIIKHCRAESFAVMVGVGDHIFDNGIGTSGMGQVRNDRDSTGSGDRSLFDEDDGMDIRVVKDPAPESIKLCTFGRNGVVPQILIQF